MTIQYTASLNIPTGLESSSLTHIQQDMDADLMERIGHVLPPHIPCSFCYAFVPFGALPIQISQVCTLVDQKNIVFKTKVASLRINGFCLGL